MTGMGGRRHPRFTDFYVPAKGLNTDKRRELAILAFEVLENDRRPTLHAIESVPDSDKRSTAGTILQVVVDALNGMGDSTESTVGAVREKLGMVPTQLHDAFCRCKNGTDMSGHQAAAHLRALD